MSFTWSKLLALLMLSAMTSLLVWFFVDPRYFVYEAEVQGTALVSADEVYNASGLDTLSIFYVDRGQTAEHIRRQVPGVDGAQVECQLPGRIRIRIREQDARFVWNTDGAALLVNAEGRVLGVDDGSSERVIFIHDMDGRPLETGDQVDRAVLNAVERLHSLLPEAWAFDYSRARGVSLLDARGWRIFFGDDKSLAEKVASMHAVLQKIANSGESVAVIDLRFVGSPYYK